MIKNYELALALAHIAGSLRESNEELANKYLSTAKKIMEYFDPLGDIIGDLIKNIRFEVSLEEAEELKNYDVALALATAGGIEEARIVTESVDLQKELDIEDFKDLDIFNIIKEVVEEHVGKIKKWKILGREVDE